MAIAVRHSGHVNANGALTLADPGAWRAAIRRHKGRHVVLTIRKLGAERPSKWQHGYYRSTLLPLAAEEWGWGDPDELHIRLKEKHLPAIIPVDEWPERRIGNETRRELPSMALFPEEVASAYIQKVIDQMRDSLINVPPPRERITA